MIYECDNLKGNILHKDACTIYGMQLNQAKYTWEFGCVIGYFDLPTKLLTYLWAFRLSFLVVF